MDSIEHAYAHFQQAVGVAALPDDVLKIMLPTNLPLFSRRLQLPIALGMDLLLTTGEHVLRRDVANRTVQADVVVMLDVGVRVYNRLRQV